MGIFGFRKTSKKNVVIDEVKPQRVEKLAHYAGSAWVKSYDGEKNLGAIGPVIDYRLQYDALRLRSWQAFLESDIAQTIIKKYINWIIDKGLRANAMPPKLILKSEGVDIDTEKYNNIVEARFNVWAKSKLSSMNGMKNFHQQTKDAFKNAAIGGDVLVILRFVDKMLKVQLIDGANVSNPMGNTNPNKTIRDGIELDKNGKHIAYWVRSKKKGTILNWERIPAVSAKSGFTTAFLVYGSEYRLNSYRGMPIIGTSLETLKKIERYKEAAVGSAEERQKIVYYIKHQLGGTGESPLGAQLATAMGNTNDGDLPVDEFGENLANNVAATTDKMTYNLPPGAELQSLESKNELFFKEFYF